VTRRIEDPNVVRDEFRGVISKSDLHHPRARWCVSRKSVVVGLIEGGVVTVAQMTELYGISAEELAHWMFMRKKYGEPGLRISRCQVYAGTAKPGWPISAQHNKRVFA
jgi:hypothetical protein